VARVPFVVFADIYEARERVGGEAGACLFDLEFRDARARLFDELQESR
jgi:hypothetical protein